MVESIAIMEYLIARYGPTPLAPAPHDPAFPAYQQFLHLGEAGLAASVYYRRRRSAARQRPSGRTGARPRRWKCSREPVEVGDASSLRARLILRRDRFTAADISVTYASELAHRTTGASLSARQRGPYVGRTSGRDGLASGPWRHARPQLASGRQGARCMTALAQRRHWL